MYESVRLPGVKQFADAMPIAEGVGRGLIARDFSAEPLGFCAQAWAADVPENEWEDRIAAMESIGATNRDLKRDRNIASLNQGSTNYCWANAPIQALHYLQARTGSTVRRFSPASVAAPINGFKNQGGWGNQALKRIIDHGCNTVEEWPANAIDRKYLTAANAESARRNRVTEWYDLPPKDFRALASALLLGHTVAIGLNWWGHEVLAIDLAIKDGKYVVIIDNSWGENWGDGGLGILTRQKATPDDAVSPRVLTPRSAA